MDHGNLGLDATEVDHVGLVGVYPRENPADTNGGVPGAIRAWKDKYVGMHEIES